MAFSIFLSSRVFHSNEVIHQSSDYRKCKCRGAQTEGEWKPGSCGLLPLPSSSPLIQSDTHSLTRRRLRSPSPSLAVPTRSLAEILISWITALPHGDPSPPTACPHPLPSPELTHTVRCLQGPSLSAPPTFTQLCPVRSACYPTFKVQGPTETPPSPGSLLGSSSQSAAALSFQPQPSAKAPLAPASLCPALGIPGNTAPAHAGWFDWLCFAHTHTLGQHLAHSQCSSKGSGNVWPSRTPALWHHHQRGWNTWVRVEAFGKTS